MPLKHKTFSKLIFLRRCSQLVFFGLFVAILWSTTYPLKGILPPETFFATDPLLTIITSSSKRFIIPGIIFSLILLALALVLGRFFCGWICPLGSMFDAVGSLRKKKAVLTDRTNKKNRVVKFVLLGLITLCALLKTHIAWVADPIVIAARFVSLNLIPAITASVDKLFVWCIQEFHLYGSFLDFYRQLKQSFLGINIYYFQNSLPIFIFFSVICLTTLFFARLWCRMLCPLGALYALTSKVSFLKRTVEECSHCAQCKSSCRMGAIRDDLSTVSGECILCMDCIYDCPEHVTRFSFLKRKKEISRSENGISRRQFLLLAAGSLFLMGFKNRITLFDKVPGNLIRPPGSNNEEEFLDRCIRCGNCMKVCPTNVLQPVMFEADWKGVWTPKLVAEIGYCEYNCTLCGEVCPTGAIPKLPLAVKQKTKLGVAKIDKSLCLGWAYNKQCIVCEEHCPVPDKAIKIKEDLVNGTIIPKPVVDENLCIGCGLCQNKCPASPVRAIKVFRV